MIKPWKRSLRNPFAVGGPELLPLSLVSAASLAAVFLGDFTHPVFAYSAYALSAYTAAAAVFWIIKAAKGGMSLLHRNVFLHRYMTETDFKAEISLCLSLGINVFYCTFKAAAGVFYHSAWFGTLAFTYMVLSLERFLLLNSIRKNQRDLIREWKKYRFCGCLLLSLTLAILGMSLYTVNGGKGSTYPGYTIYAAAGYTFYNLGIAIANFAKYRKQNNPIYEASKAVALAAALISMFSLQTAMLTAFEGSGAWRNQMNLWTSFGVFILIAAMALFMVRRGGKLITKLLL